MKIFAITDNYRGGDKTDLRAPGWRFLPDSSIFRAPNPFFLEEETDLTAAYATLALRIDRLGKSIAPRFASRYTGHVALAVNIRNLTLENRLRDEGLPIDPAWGYDRSLLLSDWVEMPFEKMATTEIAVSVPSKTTIVWRPSELIFDLPRVIEAVSQMNILKMGDVILPGFHHSGLVLNPGDTLRSTLKSEGDDSFGELALEIPIR